MKNEKEFLEREIEVIKMFASQHPEMTFNDAAIFWANNYGKTYRDWCEKNDI